MPDVHPHLPTIFPSLEQPRVIKPRKRKKPKPRPDRWFNKVCAICAKSVQRQQAMPKRLRYLNSTCLGCLARSRM